MPVFYGYYKRTHTVCKHFSSFFFSLKCLCLSTLISAFNGCTNSQKLRMISREKVLFLKFCIFYIRLGSIAGIPLIIFLVMHYRYTQLQCNRICNHCRVTVALISVHISPRFSRFFQGLIMKCV